MDSQSINHLEQKLLSSEGKNIETTTETSFETFLSARVSETFLHSDSTREEPDVLFRKETANPNQSKTVSLLPSFL